MDPKNLWIVVYLYGGMIEDIYVHDNRPEADEDFDGMSKEIDPETDDLKLFKVSLRTLKAEIVRSWFNEHPED